MNRRLRAGAEKVDQKRIMTMAKTGQIRNPNIEARNKLESSKFKANRRVFSYQDFRIPCLFRYSDLEFRIFKPSFLVVVFRFTM